MRDIKFRVWDEVNNKMTYHFLIDSQNKERWFYTKNGMQLHTDSTTKLLEYTGLKDKNNVEIYEGDILKTTGLYQEHFIVEYSDRSFELYDGKEGVVSDEHNIWDDYEIVGNIYENTELLE